ncbi:hypothetical protein GCM10028777_14080 [Angustibacter speluncae]
MHVHPHRVPAVALGLQVRAVTGVEPEEHPSAWTDDAVQLGERGVDRLVRHVLQHVPADRAVDGRVGEREGVQRRGGEGGGGVAAAGDAEHARRQVGGHHAQPEPVEPPRHLARAATGLDDGRARADQLDEGGEQGLLERQPVEGALEQPVVVDGHDVVGAAGGGDPVVGHTVVRHPPTLRPGGVSPRGA